MKSLGENEILAWRKARTVQGQRKVNKLQAEEFDSLWTTDTSYVIR